MYTGGCIIQACSFDVLPLQVVKNFGQLEVCFSIAARHQQTYCRYLGVGTSRKRFVRENENGPEPRFLPSFRSAGVAGVAIGADGGCIRGWRLSGWGFGIGGAREAARSSVYDSFGFGWNVAVGEQDSGFGRVHRDPMHETLYKARVPIFVQEPEANFGVMYEGMCVWVREDELKKFDDIVQATYAPLKVSNLLIIHMWSNRQAAIRAIGSWVEAWQAAVVVDSAIPLLWRELTHRQAEEISD